MPFGKAHGSTAVKEEMRYHHEQKMQANQEARKKIWEDALETIPRPGAKGKVWGQQEGAQEPEKVREMSTMGRRARKNRLSWRCFCNLLDWPLNC